MIRQKPGIPGFCLICVSKFPQYKYVGKRGPKPKTGSIEWSANFAYAVGLMASDGNLSSSGRHLTLVSKDIEQIENIRKCFGLKNKAKIHRGGKTEIQYRCYRVQWGDVQLCNFLNDIGLTAHKSLTIGALAIPDKYFFEFLRGDFDGDGCFYSYFDPRWKSSFMFYLNFVSASKLHIFWIQQTVERLCCAKGHFVFTNKKNGIWKLGYAKAETMIILNRMYPAGTTMYLPRKRLKIDAALRIVGKSLPTV